MVSQDLTFRRPWAAYIHDISEDVRSAKEQTERFELFMEHCRLTRPCSSLYLKGSHSCIDGLECFLQSPFIDSATETTLELSPQLVSQVTQWPAHISRLAVPLHTDDECIDDHIDMISTLDQRIALDIHLGPGTVFSTMEPLLSKIMMMEVEQISLVEEDEAEADVLARCFDVLLASGYEHHELFGFRKAGIACFHWSHVFDGGDLLGMGPWAETRMQRDQCFHVAREDKETPSGASTLTPLSRQQSAQECVMLGLRLMQGIETEALVRRFGLTVDEVFDQCVIETFQSDGYLVHQTDHLALTTKGIWFYNSILAQILK